MQGLALDRLVAAGTILLTDCCLPPPGLVLPADDGWSTFTPKQLSALPIAAGPVVGKKKPSRSPTARTLDDLALLIRRKYACATWRQLSDTAVLFRIYLVPVDLPGFQSKCLSPGDVDARRRGASALQIALGKVLGQTVVSEQRWNGELVGPSTERTVLDAAETHESLFSVWNSLASPAPYELAAVDGYARALLDDALALPGPTGLRSTLYPYQQRSLWKLLARELAPQPISDATLTPLHQSNSCATPYYIDAKCEIRLESDIYTDTRGGIIGEIMGTGKTIECLALILATRGRPALVERAPGEVVAPCLRTDLIDPTTIVGRIFDPEETFDPYADHVEPLFATPVPTLTTYLIDYLRADPSLTASDILTSDRITVASQQYAAHMPYYFDQPALETGSHRARRALADRDCSERIYVSATSLCVVPNVLVAQWQAEIVKHVEAGALKVLTIIAHEDVPHASELATYDLVLVSLGRFQLAAKKYAEAVCACNKTLDDPTRLAKCHCPIAATKARLVPFLYCHFKRVIFDEGHIVGAEKTLAVQLASRLRATARWCVTGTPTHHLVSVGGETISAKQRALDSKQIAASDADDLSRLGHIIGGFLRCSPFHRGDRDFDVYVRNPFLDKRCGAAHRIGALLERVMVRNREVDVAAVVQLPPMTERVQSLEFDDVGRTTYNCLLALFGLNSVMSEREDQDYFFHPLQRTSLARIMRNLSEAQYWLAAKDLMQQVAEALGRHDRAKAQDPGKFSRMASPDITLLDQCIRCLEDAMADSTWCTVMERCTLPFALEDVPTIIADAWDSHSRILASSMAVDTALAIDCTFFAEKILEARRDLQKLLETGSWADDEDLLEELATVGHQHSQDESREAPKKQADFNKLRDLGLLAKKPTKAAIAETPMARPFPVLSSLHAPMVTRCFAPKIDWVIDAVRTGIDDKFIVFSSSRQAVFFLAESMDIAGLSYLLLVAEGIDVKKRQQYLEAFATDPNERVLIVDIGLGSRGLTLTAANRIIFLEPCWLPDLEAQAKKRAHRIGQTRPVTVDTLVMAGSFEERMFARRKNLHSEDFRELEKPSDDRELRDLLQTAPFLPKSAAPPRKWALPVPLFPEGALLPHYLTKSGRSGSTSQQPTYSPTKVFAAMSSTPPLSPSLTLTPQSSVSNLGSALSTPSATPNMPAPAVFAPFGIGSSADGASLDVWKHTAKGLATPIVLRPSLKRANSALEVIEELAAKRERHVGFAS